MSGKKHIGLVSVFLGVTVFVTVAALYLARLGSSGADAVGSARDVGTRSVDSVARVDTGVDTRMDSPAPGQDSSAPQASLETGGDDDTVHKIDDQRHEHAPNANVAASPRIYQNSVPRRKREPLPKRDSTVYFSESARVASIGQNLSREEIEELYRYLELPVDSNPDLDHVQMNSVKNDIIGKLLTQDKLPRDLGMKLVELFENKSNDELLRNYSVQHFEPFLLQKTSYGEFSQEAPDVRAVRNAFLTAVEEKHNSIAGAALLGMERASKLDPQIDRSLVGTKAALYVGDESASLQTRIAAAQICGIMKMTSSRRSLLGLIGGAGSLSLQLAAIHSLGQIGDASDLARLEELSIGSGGLPRSAAEAAASVIRKRLGK